MNQHDLDSGHVWGALMVAVVLTLGLGLSAPSLAVAQPGQSVILAMGQWQGIDAFHQTQGRAILARLPPRAPSVKPSARSSPLWCSEIESKPVMQMRR